MVEIQAHRGPDGRAIWCEGSAGLGHCMLHTTPESLNEQLPFQRDGLVITADARIDNREELIDLLQLKTQQPEQISDSELILHAYQRWGEECPAHLLGDFAFAIWDSGKQYLFCARDHFGVKPFHYYYQPGQQFIFGTEIKAIFCYEDIPKRLNEIKISDYMLEMFEDKARTFYVDINRLPPASVMVVGRGGVRKRQYWALDPKQEIKLRSDGEYAEAYRSLFIEAVRCRLRSAFPTGAMLSGGLDSSSITCVAHDLLSSSSGSNLHTFSIIFNQIKKSDEREYIYKILEKRNCVAHFIEGDQATPFDQLEKILWFQDEPFYAPNLFLSWPAWRSISENGVRILLDGFLGDNVISHGAEYLNELANKWHWLTLTKELKQFLNQSDQKISLLKLLSIYLVQYGLKPYIPEIWLNLWRKLQGHPVDPTMEQYDLFSLSYCMRSGIRERLHSAYKYNRLIKSTRQAHHDSLDPGLIQTVLEIHNKGCSAFQFETRMPFIDKRVVEFCLSTPGNQKISQGFTRIIARRALYGLLPEEIRWRPDKGYLGWCFINGFNAHQEMVSKIINTSNVFLTTYFNLEYLTNMYNRYNKNKAANDELMTLYLITVLSIWNNQMKYS